MSRTETQRRIARQRMLKVTGVECSWHTTTPVAFAGRAFSFRYLLLSSLFFLLHGFFFLFFLFILGAYSQFSTFLSMVRFVVQQEISLCMEKKIKEKHIHEHETRKDDFL